MPRKEGYRWTQGPSLTRRRLVQGLAAGAAASVLEWSGWPARAEDSPDNASALPGKHFRLSIESLPVNFTGRPAAATAVNGSVPGPTLRWREGDVVTVEVTNHLRQTSSIHWHGIRVPSEMDGVPGLSFAGIAAGETYRYRFPVKQHGTYWYHSHSHFQEQTGLYGAIVIEPRQGDPVAWDREYVILLSDWTDTSPDRIFSNLKKESDYYNYHRRTLPDFIRAAGHDGLGRTVSERLAWARMDMSPGDILDVTGAAYTYLLNGNSPQANWTGLYRAGERIRLRIINGSSMSFFDVRIPGLTMTVVQADGNDVEPVPVDEFRIGVAETYDVLVQPPDATAYTIFAQSEDRSGYACGTLASRVGMRAAVPRMDPLPVRSMADMGMSSMRGMRMGNMAGMDRPAKDASGTGGTGAVQSSERTPGGNAGTRVNTDHSAGGGTEMSLLRRMPLAQPAADTMPLAATIPGAGTEVGAAPSKPVHIRVGPEVDNVAFDPAERLHEAGDGLNNNGRRVLTYGDLRARYRGVDGRPPTREIELHLTGNMQRYLWGLNGAKFSEAEPIVLKLGERVRFVLINDTMMEHPIHLHGLWSELENGSGEFRPYKHTITVKPAERLSYLVSADTPGRWAYHCHLLYHMEAGMFRTVVVEP